MNQEVAEKIIRANWPPDSMQCHHLSESLAFVLARSAQIETMKEKLIEERAYLLMLKKAQEGINLLLKKIEVGAHKKEYLIEARQQLKADHDLQAAGVMWDGMENR